MHKARTKIKNTVKIYQSSTNRGSYIELKKVDTRNRAFSTIGGTTMNNTNSQAMSPPLFGQKNSTTSELESNYLTLRKIGSTKSPSGYSNQITAPNKFSKIPSQNISLKETLT